MLQNDPAHRLSLADLRCHAWLVGPTASSEQVIQDLKARKTQIEGVVAINSATTVHANPNVFKRHRVQRTVSFKGSEAEEEENKFPPL